ncbi:hypothetical protein AB0A73_29080 [Glycomyces sp. NPDC047369]
MTDPWRSEDRLLHLVSSALIALERPELPDDSVYPEVVQRAVNAVALAFIRAGREAPLSVPVLVDLATSPPSEWGIGIDLDVPLLHEYSLAPTDACRSWKIAGSDPETEWFENEIMIPAITKCTQEGDQAGYTAFRRLLIERPVLSAVEFEAACDDPAFWTVADLLPACFPKAPAAYAYGGRYAVCAGCRTLMRPNVFGGWACELDRCAQAGENEPADYLEPHAGSAPRLLAAPLRTFVTGPGLVEIELERRLLKLGLDVAMWPDFDEYDLLVTFPDGSAWGIDAKDQQSGRLLGRSLKKLPDTDRLGRFYIAVPDHRLDPGGNYLAAFNAGCDPDLRPRIRFASATQVVREARRYLKELKDHA